MVTEEREREEMSSERERERGVERQKREKAKGERIKNVILVYNCATVPSYI